MGSGGTEIPFNGGMPQPSIRDWRCDFNLENGRYHCVCHKCWQAFVGHKRRVLCKHCHKECMVKPENLMAAVEEIPDLLRCPLCESNAELEFGFDTDLESTTATIVCSACPIQFGPSYPDTKADLVKFVIMWNDRK